MKSDARNYISMAFVVIGLSILKPAIAEETTWSCWHYNTNIHCVPAFTTPPVEMESPYQRALDDYRQVEHQDNGRWIIVPLHSEPRNWARVQMLVESVMCGGKPGCSVDLNQTHMKAALLDIYD